MSEMLFAGVFVVPLVLILVLASFPTLIIAGLAMFAAAVYTLVVHPQWCPIWLFCFLWVIGFWMVAAAIHDDFLEEREQQMTSCGVGAASGRPGAMGISRNEQTSKPPGSRGSQ